MSDTIPTWLMKIKRQQTRVIAVQAFTEQEAAVLFDRKIKAPNTLRSAPGHAQETGAWEQVGEISKE